MVVDIWKDLGKIKYVKSHNIITEACPYTPSQRETTCSNLMLIVLIFTTEVLIIKGKKKKIYVILIHPQNKIVWHQESLVCPI